MGRRTTEGSKMQSLDVGILTSHLSFDKRGGSNYSIHRLASELEQRGHQATVYTVNYEHDNHVPVPHSYELHPVELEHLTVVDGAYEFIQRIGHHVRAHDVFHVYVPGVIPLFGLLRLRTGEETPIVATLNGYTTFCTNTSMMSDECWNQCTFAKKALHTRSRGVDRLKELPRMAFNDVAAPSLMNRLDDYFCLSPAVRDIHQGIGINDELLSVVPNMIDPTFRTTDPFDTDEPRMLYVGRLEDMKGIDILLQAVARLGRGDFYLDVVGDNVLKQGSSLEEYREDSAQLGIDDVVTFHGWVEYDELSDYYANSDIFVHPGLWPEPFGRTIIEAMQHGLPVVCSDVGGPPWVSGSAGVSYPPDDPESLAQLLRELLTNPDRREHLANNASSELRRFEPDRVMETIVGKYRTHLRGS